MNYKKEFERMMETQTMIALATVAGGAPNVRIVNFYYDSLSPNENVKTTLGYLKENPGQSSPKAFMDVIDRLEVIRSLNLI